MKIYKTISNSKNNAHHNGASLVEFAVVCILFFILLFSIIDFAILLYNKQVINNAAREGARYGLVARPLDSPISVNSIENRVLAYLNNRIINFGPQKFETPSVKFYDIKNHFEKSYCRFGYEIEVIVTCDYQFLFLPFDLNPIVSNVTMRCE